MKKTVLLTCCALLLLLFSKNHSFAQDWELVKQEDFSAAMNSYPQLTTIADFQYSNCVASTYGGSGTPTDICALNQGWNYFMAFEVELSSNYEYRITWNVKTNTNISHDQFKKRFQYYLSGMPGGFEQAVSSIMEVPYIQSIQAPGEDHISDVFAGVDGIRYLEVGPADTAPGLTAQVRFDDFRLERRLVDNEDCPWAGPDVTICPGECVTIGCDLAEEDVPGNSCLSWLPADGIAEGSLPFGAMIEVCPDETTTYTIYITNDEGDLINSDEVTVFVEPAEIIVNASENNVCPGTPVTLTAEMINGQTSEFFWDNGMIGETIVVSPEYSKNYRVVVTDANTNCTIEGRVRVNTKFAPEINIYTSTSTICELPLDGLIKETMGGDRSTEEDCEKAYTWLFVAGDPGLDVTYEWSTSETDPFIKAEYAGVYSVTVTNSFGCESVASIEITSCALVDITPEIISTPQGDQAVLDAGGGFISYEWQDGSTNQTIPVTESGLYEVIVVNEFGCVGKSQIQIENECNLNDYLLFQVLGAFNQNDNQIDLFILSPDGNMNEAEQTEIEALLGETSILKNFTSIGYQRDLIAISTKNFFWLCEDSGVDPSVSQCVAIHQENHPIRRAWLNGETHVFPFLVKPDGSGGFSYVDQQICLHNNAWNTFDYQLSFSPDVNWTNEDSYETPPINFSLTPEGTVPYNTFPEVVDAILKHQFRPVGQTADPGAWMPVSSMGIEFEPDSESPSELPAYKLTYEIEPDVFAVVPENIEQEEGSLVKFKVMLEDETGNLVDLEEGNHSAITWYPDGFLSSNTVFNGEPVFSHVVHSSSQGVQLFSVNVDGGQTIPSATNINSTPTPLMPGIQLRKDPDDQIVPAPKNDRSSWDYVELAIAKIEAYENSHEDFELLDIVIGEDEREVNVHLVDLGDKSGSAVLSVTDPTGLLSLDLNSLDTMSGCPTYANFLKKIDEDQFDQIKNLVEMPGLEAFEDYPVFLQQILADGGEVAMKLQEWINLEDANQISEVITEGTFGLEGMLYDLQYNGVGIAYNPSLEEVENLLVVDNKVTLRLNPNLLNKPRMTSFFQINLYVVGFSGSASFTVNNWYLQGGDFTPSYYDNLFFMDLDELRVQQYANTIAHELGHAKHSVIMKAEKFRWQLLRNEFGNTFFDLTDQSNRCFPLRVGNTDYCSRGSGHELGNPDDDTACESADPFKQHSFSISY